MKNYLFKLGWKHYNEKDHPAEEKSQKPVKIKIYIYFIKKKKLFKEIEQKTETFPAMRMDLSVI